MIDSGPLAVHVGIAMGEVVAGVVGSDWRRGYTVTGGAANVAARLLDRAVAGETLVSAEVYHATSHAADYEPLGGQSLKGLESLVEAWRLTGLRRPAAGGSILAHDDDGPGRSLPDAGQGGATLREFGPSPDCPDTGADSATESPTISA